MEVGVHEFLTLVLDAEAIIISGSYVTEEKASTLLVFQIRCESGIEITIFTIPLIRMEL